MQKQSGKESAEMMSENVVGTARVKRGMAEMLKGGVIMDVVNVEQAKIAEDAGAVAVMALERVPADIRAQGGVSRMSDPSMIDAIKAKGAPDNITLIWAEIEDSEPSNDGLTGNTPS